MIRSALVLAGLSLAAGALAASRDVTLTVPGAVLHATLETPDGVTRPPVALILAGSGPTDRDGNSVAGLRTDAYRKLAAALNASGIATLRPDKRGVGTSTAADPREEALSIQTYVDDARAWLAWSPGQGLGKVAVIGHSEGALVGLAAVQGRADVAAYVSLAGAGENVAATLRRQLTANPANPPALVSEAGRVITELQAGRRVANVSPVLGPLFRPSVQPYLISWMRLDPAALLKATQVPTLIVQGDRDLQVTPNDARALLAARPSATLLLIPGMNHVLVQAPADLSGNAATYAQPALPLAPALVSGLSAFLKQALKP